MGFSVHHGVHEGSIPSQRLLFFILRSLISVLIALSGCSGESRPQEPESAVSPSAVSPEIKSSSAMAPTTAEQSSPVVIAITDKDGVRSEVRMPKPISILFVLNGQEPTFRGSRKVITLKQINTIRVTWGPQRVQFIADRSTIETDRPVEIELPAQGAADAIQILGQSGVSDIKPKVGSHVTIEDDGHTVVAIAAGRAGIAPTIYPTRPVTKNMPATIASIPAGKKTEEKEELPENLRELHVVGIHSGITDTGQQIHGPTASVEVNRPGKLITLVLTAFNSCTWDVTVKGNTKLEKVILGGFNRQAVRGLPSATPVVDAWRGSNDKPISYCYDPSSPTLRQQAKEIANWTDLSISSFQGVARYRPENRFIIDKVRHETTALYEGPRPSPRSELPQEVADATFTAHQYSGMGINLIASYGTFTLQGPRHNSLEPLPRGVDRVTYDPVGKRYYGIQRHRVVEVDMEPQKTTPLDLGLDVPEMSWPSEVTFDTKRGRLIVGSSDVTGYLYEYSPKSRKWSVLAKRPGWIDIFAYCEKEDCFYGLDTGPGGSRKVGVLCKLSLQGAVLSRIVLGDPLTPGNLSTGTGVRPTQVVSLGKYVAILTAPGGPIHNGGLDGNCIYLVEVSTGRIWLASREQSAPVPKVAPVGQPVAAVFGEITSLAVDRSNILWIGSRSGVFSLRNGKLSLFDAPNTGIPDMAITAIHVDRNNVKWFGSAHGQLYSFDDIRWQAFPALTKVGYPGKEITCIRSDQRSRIWLAARDKTLFRMIGQETERIDPRSNAPESDSAAKKPPEVPSGDIELSSIDFDADGKLWAAERHSLFRFDGKSWTSFSGDQLPSSDISGLWCNPQSKEVFLATANGLFAFKDGKYRLLAEESKSIPVQTVCGTPSGRCAAGCGKPGGALLGDGSNFRRYSVGTPLADESVQATAFEKQGRVWFATLSRGLVCLDGERWQTLAPLDSIVPANPADKGPSPIAPPSH